MFQYKENKNKGSSDTLSSNKIINTKKIKSYLLGTFNYNSNNMTFLSKNQKKKSYKKKKDNEKLLYNKKPESHRNYCHSKIISGNNSNNKNKMKINNNNYKVQGGGLKHAPKYNSQKIIGTPCSPCGSSTSTNFYFQSYVNTRKNSTNNNLDKNTKNKKVVNNYNIVNNIHDNSTQINIFPQ